MHVSVQYELVKFTYFVDLTKYQQDKVIKYLIKFLKLTNINFYAIGNNFSNFNVIYTFKFL